MKLLTLQEVFDKIWERAKDPRKSLRKPHDPENSLCAYRSPDGLKCFMGVLLPDQNYDPSMDDEKSVPTKTGIGYVKDFIPLDLSVSEEHLYRLQRIHDSWEPENWRSRLIAFATSQHLTVPQ